MIQLLEGGTYLVNGTELVEPAKAAAQGLPAPEEAAKQTMAYNILRDHNTSGNMEKLQIKFDKLTSHDITFVGIIQTARASGLEKFPVPYVLTNCHNSLCAVGGKIRWCLCSASSGSYSSVCKRDACRRWQDDPGI